MNRKPADQTDEPLCEWNTVQEAERAAIDPLRPDERTGYVGLAFSGGGIRSATFNLGVIQALAAQRLLGKFDYLSTVSGGGYIGSWLTALVHRASECTPADRRRIGDELERGIALSADGAGVGHAPSGERCPMYVREAVEHLRTFSNYLTPRPGFFGLDTLTGIAIYTRNLMLNFALILVPAVASFLLLQGVAVEAMRFQDSAQPLAAAAILLALTSALIGFIFAPAPVAGTRTASATSDVSTMLTAFSALLFCGATALWFWKAAPLFPAPDPRSAAYYGAIASLALWALTILSRGIAPYALNLGARVEKSLRSAAPGTRTAQPASNAASAAAKAGAHLESAPSPSPQKSWDKDDRLVTVPVILGLLFGAAVSGAVGGILLSAVFDLVRILTGNAPAMLPEWGLLAHLQAYARDAGDGPVEWVLITLLPPAIMAVLAVVFALQVAIGRRGLSVHDTEILGRIGGAVSLVTTLWIAAFALAGFTAGTLASIDWIAAWAGITWIASTLAGVMLGKSRSTDGRRSASRLDRVVAIFPHVFMAGFALLAALLAAWIAQALAPPAAAQPADWVEWIRHYTHAARGAGGALWGVGIGLFAGAAILACTVDINFFSYNLFYRNRLARCYLGASRWATNSWRPSRITGLDPDDDVRIKDLVAATGEAQRPYHIVNTALNLTRPANTAWLQRKAAPFVFTPQYCGYSMPGTGGLGEKTYYRPTARYLGDQGPELSYAMTISGAAASPNMGYHSSPAMAFLLTVFNVRLGSWCGNPNTSPSWKQMGPRFAYRYLLAELFGRTDENKPFVYLSDGGHFDNLGIYELVRRRCKLIVASDAGADPEYELEDLANAIEKCELDFGVRFGDMDLKAFAAREQPYAGPVEARRQRGAQFLIASIHYSERAEDDGVLVYIKSSICGDEPADVLHYAAAHALFPHESTSDQWFDEQQFESYRKLGFRAAKAASGAIAGALSKMVTGAVAATGVSR